MEGVVLAAIQSLAVGCTESLINVEIPTGGYISLGSVD